MGQCACFCEWICAGAALRGQRAMYSEGMVRPVAEGRVLRVFTSTKMDGFRLFRRKLDRGEGRAVVRPVAERLVLAAAAGAPVIGLALFYLHGIRELLRDFRFFCHDNHPFVVPAAGPMRRLPPGRTARAPTVRSSRAAFCQFPMPPEKAGRKNIPPGLSSFPSETDITPPLQRRALCLYLIIAL